MSRRDGSQRILQRGRGPKRQDDAGEDRLNALRIDSRQLGGPCFRRASELPSTERAEGMGAGVRI